MRVPNNSTLPLVLSSGHIVCWLIPWRQSGKKTFSIYTALHGVSRKALRTSALISTNIIFDTIRKF